MKTLNVQWKASSIMLAWALSLTSLRADFATDLSDAAKPLAEGVPEVAVARLRPLLNKDLTDDQWRAAAAKLSEALVAANRPDEALSLLQDTRLGQMPAAKFWRAQALASLKRWSEALPLYQVVSADKSSPLRAEAIFGAAEMLRALARSDEALQRLATLLHDKRWSNRTRLRSAELFLEKAGTANARRLLDQMGEGTTAERKERRYLRGQLELKQQRPERAIAIFEALLKRPEGANHDLLLAALFAIADAHLQLKTPEPADDLIEDFIEHHPGDADLPLLFAKLDQLYRAERKPARTELERWTREPEQPRRGFAQWHLARLELRAGHRDRALQFLSALRKGEAKSPALAGGLLEYAQLALEDQRFDEALAVANDARSLHPRADLLDRINLLAAQAHYRAKRFEAATAAFEQIARSKSPLSKMSMFNASLGWLQLGDQVRFVADYKEFEKQGGDEDARAELRLEEGLVQAAKGDKKAAASLQNFLRDFPENRRASEAWVALAELAFHATPPRLDEARKNLARAADSKPTPAAAERAAYLGIWIEDFDGTNDAKVIDLADGFLKEHETSKLAAEVRMKLAEACYRRQDFSNAQTQFEILARQNPSDPMTEKALFFAAESAMSSMGPQALDHAIVLFDQVAQLKGELRWAARNEQAVIERKLGKPQEALVLYDEVLKNDAKPSEKREALCGKGDIFFDMGANDPSNYQRAIDAYEQLANDINEPSHWRNQALFKKGVSLEKKANRDEALVTFYRVLEDRTRPDRPPEFFWFYKAGFNAARLLEDDAKWSSAAAVYEKLAAAGGARSDEAKARLNRLRLEHFLWAE